MAWPCRAAYSNRAACHTQLGAFGAAIEDAERCIALEPAWGKGYWRKGHAEHLTKEYVKASPVSLVSSRNYRIQCHRVTAELTILSSSGWNRALQTSVSDLPCGSHAQPGERGAQGWDAQRDQLRKDA
jgi:hypothetical protein